MALQLKREIRGMMEMLTFAGWVPRLVTTEAHQGTGVAELWDAIVAHEEYLRTSGDLVERRRAAFAHRVRALVLGALEGRIDRRIEELIAAADASAEDPYRAAAALLAPLDAALPPADGDHFARTPKPRASVKGL
jgi:LAO/AO transport system kinase